MSRMWPRLECATKHANLILLLFNGTITRRGAIALKKARGGEPPSLALSLSTCLPESPPYGVAVTAEAMILSRLNTLYGHAQMGQGVGSFISSSHLSCSSYRALAHIFSHPGSLTSPKLTILTNTFKHLQTLFRSLLANLSRDTSTHKTGSSHRVSTHVFTAFLPTLSLCSQPEPPPSRTAMNGARDFAATGTQTATVLPPTFLPAFHPFPYRPLTHTVTAPPPTRFSSSTVLWPTNRYPNLLKALGLPTCNLDLKKMLKNSSHLIAEFLIISVFCRRTTQ
jgi:hypothetical protein